MVSPSPAGSWHRTKQRVSSTSPQSSTSAHASERNGTPTRYWRCRNLGEESDDEAQMPQRREPRGSRRMLVAPPGLRGRRSRVRRGRLPHSTIDESLSGIDGRHCSRPHTVWRAPRVGRVCRGLSRWSANQSRSTTLRRELLIFKPPLYSMNPSFRNLFMKKFTRERVVPTISANVSCDTFGKVR